MKREALAPSEGLAKKTLEQSILPQALPQCFFTEGLTGSKTLGMVEGLLYSMVVTSNESLGSEARNCWSLVARTATKYRVFAFSLVIVKLVPVALVVAFVQRWPSSEYCTVYA